MKPSMCENCIKYKTIYCPNSDECLAREDKPFYEDKYTILTKNVALEGVLEDYTKIIQQLKIQISAREENYKKLEDNWNKLKEYAKDNLYFYSGYQGEDLETDIAIQGILNKMQELERGVSDDSN